MEEINPVLCMSEDDSTFGEMLMLSLEDIGIGTERLTWIREAHNAIEHMANVEEAPKWVLIDIYYDNSVNDGFDVLDAMKKRWGNGGALPPRTVISTSADPSDIKEAQKRGATNYVVKEFSVDEMEALMQRIKRCYEKCVTGNDLSWEVFS